MSSQIISSQRRFLFLLTGSRKDGNTEQLARLAATLLPASVETEWLSLLEYPLPAFEDIRHEGDGTYPEPEGNAQKLMLATLAATDIVFVTPLYWYSVPANAKLYLDHWSGWMRVPNKNFKIKMSKKTAWTITTISDEDERVVEPLVATLQLSTKYLGMTYGGTLVGFGNRPGDVLNDEKAIAKAKTFFS
ncbi:MAG: flavodoxin family protein [Trueperaceae bacterium]